MIYPVENTPEISFAFEHIADQETGVFADPLFPRRMGVTEIDLHADSGGKDFMLTHLPALVAGDAFNQFRFNRLKSFLDVFLDFRSRITFKPIHKHIAYLPFDNNV